MKDHVLRRYKTTGKVVVPYVLILRFLDSKRKTEDSEPAGSELFLNLTGFYFLGEPILVSYFHSQMFGLVLRGLISCLYVAIEGRLNT